MSKRTKARTTLFSGIALAVLAIVAVPAALRDGDSDTKGEGDEALPVPVSTPQAAVMWRCGLDPEALCAAGLSSAEAGAVAARAQSFLDANPGDLSTADAGYAAARASHDALVRTVRSGLASPAEVSDCQAAATMLASAETARQAAIQEIVDAAQAGLSAAKTATLGTIRGNRSWRLPLQYLVEERGQADWVHLRDALDNQRISAEAGEQPDATLQAELAAVNADADVAAAKASLDASLAAVITAWNAELSQ